MIFFYAVSRFQGCWSGLNWTRVTPLTKTGSAVMSCGVVRVILTKIKKFELFERKYFHVRTMFERA